MHLSKIERRLGPIPKRREPVRDIDTAVVDSMKVLDPNRPIREAEVIWLFPSILPFDLQSMANFVSAWGNIDAVGETAATARTR